MSAAENKAIVRQFYEDLWNGRNLDLADELFADDCVTHQLQSGTEPVATPRGPEAIKHHVGDWLRGFPDLRFTVEEMIAEGDLVVSRSVLRGSHTGTWLGIPPTGKHLDIRMSVTHRIENAKIAEDWVLVEALGLFQQLGLVAATEELLKHATE
jgi:steroid delta-isomerase-like uncharacterized protein